MKKITYSAYLSCIDNILKNTSAMFEGIIIRIFDIKKNE